MQGQGGGPPRVPDEVKLFNGTYEKCKSGDPNERVILEGVPEPGDLSGEALAAWNEIVPELIQGGIVKRLDGIELRMMCEWLAEYRIAMRQINKSRLKQRDTKKMAALRRHANAALRAYKLIACRFGMNTSDRCGIRVPKPEKKFEARNRG